MIIKDNYKILKYKIDKIIKNYENLNKDEVLIELKKCINNKILKK